VVQNRRFVLLAQPGEHPNLARAPATRPPAGRRWAKRRAIPATPPTIM
jgi:hypothetical protein